MDNKYDEKFIIMKSAIEANNFSVPGILTRYPNAGACPAARKKNKLARNMLVSCNMDGEVNLSFFWIASKWIFLVGTCRSAPCYKYRSRCNCSSPRLNRWIVDWQ